VLKSLLRFWFTFEKPVSRGVYLRHGALLMGIKYAADALIVWLARGVLWLPTDYIATGTSLAQSKLAGAPGWLPIVLARRAASSAWSRCPMGARASTAAPGTSWTSIRRRTSP
jgi:hypothetical protein